MAPETPPFDDELLSAYLDDELAPEERARVEAWLAADPAARQLLDELRSVSEAVKSLPQESLPGDLSETVLRRAERAMLTTKPPSGEPASAGGAAGLVELAKKIPIGRSRRAWAWAGMTIAAGLLIMVFEKGANQDAELPAEVALHDVKEVGKLPPLELRAAESSPASRTTEEVTGGIAGFAVESRSELPASGGAVLQPNRSDADESTLDSAVPTDRFGGGGGFARSATAQVQEGAPANDGALANAKNTGLLVVHVNAKPEALESQRIDEVFARNGIAVEAPATEGVALQEGVPPSVDAAASAPAAGERLQRESPPQPAERARNLDVVFVEAEPAQIVGCLSEIDADRANYLGVSVDDQRGQADPATTDKNAIDWKQHNRGSVPAQQKVQLAPDNNFYLQSEGRQIAIGRNDAAQGSAQRGAPKSNVAKDAQAVQRGRALRMQTQLGDDLAESRSFGMQFRGADQQRDSNEIDDMALARRAMQKIADKGNTLQVLFVLTCPTEHASPAALPPASSPQPESPVP